jgi:hypothetical protein
MFTIKVSVLCWHNKCGLRELPSALTRNKQENLKFIQEKLLVFLPREGKPDLLIRSVKITDFHANLALFLGIAMTCGNWSCFHTHDYYQLQCVQQKITNSNDRTIDYGNFRKTLKIPKGALNYPISCLYVYPLKD